VVLYTACDEGKAKNETELKKRARQNVVLEHGWLMSKLSRKFVAAIVEDGVEFPETCPEWSEYLHQTGNMICLKN
jgi:predicted nucleotide-binding protein